MSRGLGSRGCRQRPNRSQRFLSAVYRQFVEQGEWSSREDLQRRFARAGVEFDKSWPRLSSQLVRIENGLVILTVEGLSQVDAAHLFLANFIGALHIAAEQYLSDGAPLLTVEKLKNGIPGVTEIRAKGLMTMLESEGLLTRGSPDAGSGILTVRVARFTGAENRDEYIGLKRRMERGRRRARVRDAVHQIWSRVLGPDSSLWAKLASAVVLLLLSLAVGAVGGLFNGDSHRKDGQPSIGPARLERGPLQSEAPRTPISSP